MTKQSVGFFCPQQTELEMGVYVKVRIDIVNGLRWVLYDDIFLTLHGNTIIKYTAYHYLLQI